MGLSVYFALTKSNLSEYSFPKILNPKNGTAIADRSISPIMQKVSDDVTGAFNSMVAKGGELVGGLVEDAKTETFHALKEAVNTKINTAGESFGVTISSEQQDEIDAPIVFAMKKGSFAYFTVENRENSKIQYEVNWRDGSAKDMGSLDAGKSKVVSHSWNKAGNYDIQFKIISSEKNKTYNITLSIF